MKKTLLVSVIVLISFTQIKAQWTQITDQDFERSMIRYMLYSSNSILAVPHLGGIFRTDNNAVSWSYSGIGMDSSTNEVSSLAKFGSDLYARIGDFGNFYKSSNNGNTWARFSPIGIDQNVSGHGLGSANNKLFTIQSVCDSLGMCLFYLYYSNNGTTWNRGLKISDNYNWYNSELLPFSNNRMYFSNYDSLWYTTDGINKTLVTFDGIGTNQFSDPDRTHSGEPNGNYIYTIDSDSAYRYNLTSQKWENIWSTAFTGKSLDRIATTDVAIFASAFSFIPNLQIHLFRSLDHGSTWVQISNPGPSAPSIDAICQISDSQLVAQFLLGDMHYSSDTGSTWTIRRSGLLNSICSQFAQSGSSLLTLTGHELGVLRSADSGITWDTSNNGLPIIFPGFNIYFTQDLFASGNNVYVTIQKQPDGDTIYIYRSGNQGTSWSEITTIPNYPSKEYAGSSSSSFFMRFGDQRAEYDWDTTALFYKTSDGGYNWSNITSNFFTTMNLKKVYGFAGKAGPLFMFAEHRNLGSKIFSSLNGGASWTDVSTGAVENGRQFKSADMYSGDFSPIVIGFGANNTPILIVRNQWQFPQSDSLFYLSGNIWMPMSTTGLPQLLNVYDIDYNNGYWYLSTTTGVYISNNGGWNWTQEANSNLYLGINGTTLNFLNDYIFLGTVGNGIWKNFHQTVQLGADKYVCIGDSVTLTATAPDSSFQWCCGLGTNKTVTILPSTSGSYTATATDIYGFVTVDTVNVIISPSPVADFSINDSLQCLSNNNFVFTNASGITSGTLSYYWNFGDGNNSILESPSHSYTTSGTYDVKLIATSNNNCSDSTSKAVYFDSEPVANISASGDTTFCEGESVVLIANFDSNYSYLWLSNGIPMLPAQTLSYTNINQSGDYSVKLTDNRSGCYNTSEQITVVVNSINFTISFLGSPLDITPPTTVAFANLTPDRADYNFYWDFGDDNTSSHTEPTHEYLYNGLYTVTLMAEHKTTGCFDTLIKPGFITSTGGSNDPCTIVANITYSGSSLMCEGDSILLTATSGAGFNYQWIHNNTGILNAIDSTFIAKEKGSYRVMINDTICSRFSDPFVLSHYSIAKPVIEVNGSIQPCSNDSMELYINPLPLWSNFKWSTGESGTSIWVNSSGDYSISAKDVSGCTVTSEPYKVNTAALMPEICIVTVDSAAGYNLIVWERRLSTIVDSYYIYKETTKARVYSKVGSVSYDDLSVFVDSNSNPAKKADRYKISLLDNCGTESALSEPHKTMHVTASEGTSGENNLIWSHYDGFPILTYYIYSGTTPNNLQLLDSIQSNLNSYTHLNPPAGLVFYRVTFIKQDDCEPLNFRGISSGGPYSQSLSNLKDYTQKGSLYLLVSSQNETIDSTQGSSIKLNIYTNLLSWTATSDQSWLTLTNDISKGSIIATANSKNPETSSRTAIITLSGVGASDVNITITQLGSAGTIGVFEAALANSLQIYPNPYNRFTNISYELRINSFVKAEVYNVIGKSVCKLVNEFQEVGKYNYQFNAGSYGFTSGLYFLRFEVAGNVEIRKLVELR